MALVLKTLAFIFAFYISDYHVCCNRLMIWIPNTNYDNKLNWIGHELPCESSRVLFPDELQTSVFLPNRVSVREIKLPRNGELLLNEEGVIELTGLNVAESCSDKDVLFKSMQMEPWFKPDNWKQLMFDGTETNPIPHIERIPCIYDDVVFPKDSSFWVQYPEIPITVNSFTIENRQFSDRELQTYFLSNAGRRQFKNLDYQPRHAIISVKNEKCSAKSGCECHSYPDEVLSSVCESRSRYTCEAANCVNPVRPIGHCCDICGAHLLLKYTNEFDLQQMRNDVKNFLKEYQPYINSYISKVEGNLIQITLVDKHEYDETSVRAAKDLEREINSNPKYGASAKLFASGQIYYPGSQVKHTFLMLLGTLLGVLISFSILYCVYGPAGDKPFSFKFPFGGNLRPYLFARFYNNTDGLEISTRSVASSLFNLDRAFDNPLYGEPIPSTSRETQQETDDSQNKHEMLERIPLYSELKKKESVEEEE